MDSWKTRVVKGCLHVHVGYQRAARTVRSNPKVCIVGSDGPMGKRHLCSQSLVLTTEHLGVEGFLISMGMGWARGCILHDLDEREKDGFGCATRGDTQRRDEFNRID